LLIDHARTRDRSIIHQGTIIIYNERPIN
jgi:hypothetical protein